MPFFFFFFFVGAGVVSSPPAKEMETAPKASDRPSINVINFLILITFSLSLEPNNVGPCIESWQVEMNPGLIAR